MTRRIGLVALVVLILILGAWAVGAFGPPPARAGSYEFLWGPELWGYGGYQALLGDLNGDGADELVLQVMAGEYEGQEPAPAVITGVYGYDPGAVSPDEQARSQAVGALVAVTDLDGDGQAELLAREGWEGPLRPWRLDEAARTLVPAPAALLDEYRARGGFLPDSSTPSISSSPQDVNGDGLLDHLALTEEWDGLHLVVKTAAGRRAIPLAALVGQTGERASEPDATGAGLADLKVEAWPAGGEPGWPLLLVGARLEGGGAHLTVWVPDEKGYTLAWERLLDAAAGPYDLPPEWALLELTGDQSPELVSSQGGVLEVLSWQDGAFKVAARTPENGGLGWAGLFAADMDGDGRRELVARHVSPDLYTHHLKIYEFQGPRLVGLADVKKIGSGTGGQTLAWPWGEREVLLVPRQFEQARPEALGLAF